MSKKKPKIPMKGGDEFEALTTARKYYVYLTRSGVAKAIKKKYTLQIQDLRRQLVTKKAFDEDESQREISRLKKELQFMEMQIYNAKRSKQYGKENQDSNSALRPALDVKNELENEN